MSKSKILAAALAGALLTVSFIASANAAPGDGTQRTWTGNRTSGTATTPRTRGTASNQRGGTRANGPIAIKPPVVVVRPAPEPVRPPVQVSHRDRPNTNGNSGRWNDGDNHHRGPHDYRRENGNRSWYNVRQASGDNDGYDRHRRPHRRWWHRNW